MSESLGSMLSEVRQLKADSERIKRRLDELRPAFTKAAKAAFKEMLTALVNIPNGVLADGKEGTVLSVRTTRLTVEIGGQRWDYTMGDVWPNAQAELPSSVRDTINRGECWRVSRSNVFGLECVEEMPR